VFNQIISIASGHLRGISRIQTWLKMAKELAKEFEAGSKL